MNKAFSSQTRKRRDPLEKVGVDVRVIFKWIVEIASGCRLGLFG